MDQELVLKLNQLATRLNSLMMNGVTKPNDVRTLNDEYEGIRDKITRFNSDEQKRVDSFKREISANIDALNGRIDSKNNSGR